jgi:sugar (pentulose or hexulose) kinase
MEYFIGLDIGTSSIKGVLLSYDGDKESLASIAGTKTVYHPARLGDGPEYVGYSAEKLYQNACGVIRALLNSLSLTQLVAVKGLAIASASGNTVLVSDKGEPMHDAFSWTSPPAQEEYDRFFGEKSPFGAVDPEEVYRACGWPISATFPPGHLSYIAAHKLELIKAASKAAMTTEYIIYRLCGEWATDPSTATPSYLCDQEKAEWLPSMYERVGVRQEQLPRIGYTGETVGKITPSAAADSGLPTSCRVVLGSFDHPSAARGAAPSVLREGQLLLSCGTSWVVFAPINEKETVIRERLLCDPFETARGGAWGGMFSLESVAAKIDKIVTKYVSSAPNRAKHFDAAAEQAEPGCGGLVIDPTADADRDFSAYEPKNVARAVMEGTARLLKDRLDALAESSGLRFSSAAMAGGPSNSKIWRKIIEETLGYEVTVSYASHTGALGAARVAQGK